MYNYNAKQQELIKELENKEQLEKELDKLAMGKSFFISQKNITPSENKEKIQEEIDICNKRIETAEKNLRVCEARIKEIKEL